MSTLTATAPSTHAWSNRPGAAGRLLPSEPLMSLACRAVPPEQRAEARAVDVGCGSGRNLAGLASLGFQHLIGIDHNPELLTEARANLTDIGVATECVCGDLNRLPLADTTIDLTVSWGVMFVLGGRNATQQGLCELKRITRPGGAIITDWRTSADALARFVGEVVEPSTIVLSDQAPSELGGLTYSFWDRNEVEAFHVAAGLQIERLLRQEVCDVLGNQTHSWWQVLARRVD